MIKWIRAVIAMLYILAAPNSHSATSNSATCDFELIKNDDARQPSSGFPGRLRLFTASPVITVNNLGPEETTSPIDFNIELQSRSGASINRNSLQVYYLVSYQEKKVRIDLLPRIRAIAHRDKGFVIRICGKVPPGQYQISVSVKDDQGGKNQKDFDVRIIESADPPK